MGDGIAADVLEGLLVRVLGNGKGAEETIKTTGDSSPHSVLGLVNRILPAVTLINNGSATVNFGAGGTASHPLPPGASYTYRWKNPKVAQLVINDLGTSAVVDVIS